MPKFVFGESNRSIAIFLGKLWQGDGAVSVVNSQLMYATSSLRLAHDVQHLLLRFGIISTIHSKRFKYRGGIKLGWSVVVSHRENISLFANAIGAHLIGPKQEALMKLKAITEKSVLEKAILARGTRDTIPSPFFAAIRESMLASGLSAKVLAERTGLAERLFGSDSRKKGYQRDVIAIMANALESAKLRSYAESDIFWDEVASITPCGKEMTYDLTVPPHHNFVANDIIVHNSHAASYGKVAYQTSYMKANYPALYMSAVLTAESGDTETVAEVIAECKRMGIPVLPPDINESFQGFTVVEDANGKDQIRFGLTTIKNFGEGISNSIIEERDRGGKFKSIADFLDRIKDRSMNRKSLESLIKCGAFDNLGERGQLMANIEGLLAYNKEHGKVENQDSLFGSFGDPGGVTVPGLRLEPAEPAPTKEKLQWEKELLGLYVSGHPLEAFREKLAGKVPISKIKETMGEGAIAVVSGIVEEIRPMITKKGDNMAFIKISDMSTSLDCVAFPKAFKEFGKLLVPESCIAIKGKISHRNGEVSMLIDAIKAL